MDSNLIYADLFNIKACSNAQGSTFSFPTLIAGGKYSYSLRFIEYSAGQWITVNPNIANIRASIGLINAKPTSGSFQLLVNSHTTPFIPFNVTPINLQKILNTTDPSDNHYICEIGSSGIIIKRQDNSHPSLSVVSNHLLPLSTITLDLSEPFDGVYEYILSYKQLPVAFSSNGSQVLPPKPSVTVIQHGGSDPSGTIRWNTIQQLFIPPTFAGTYQLTEGYFKTDQFSISDIASSVQKGINAMYAAANSTAQVVVTNPENYICQIEFKGGLAGTDVPPLGVEVFSAPPGDWTFVLNLATQNVFDILSNQSKVTLPIEVEADFYNSDGVTFTTTKLFNTNVTIVPCLISPNFASSVSIDWLDSSHPKDYIPFDANQVITGQQSYTSVIGNGTSATFQINHNLGTDDISNVLIRENKSLGLLLGENDYSVEFNDQNYLTITMLNGLIPSANSLIAVITAAGPTSTFQAHTHTIAQIDDLQFNLDQLGSQVAYLLSLIPTTTVGATTSDAPNGQVSVVSFGEILPDPANESNVISISSQIAPQAPASTPAITALPGSDLQNQLTADQASLAALKAQLAAAKSAADAAAAAGLTPQQAAAQASNASVSTLMTVPLMPINEVIGYVGTATPSSAGSYTTSQLPNRPPSLLTTSNFNRELWNVPMNSSMFSVNRILNIDWAVSLQALRANCGVSYDMVVELGSWTEGNNLNISWNTASPVFSQNIVLTEDQVTHSFGLSISNLSKGYTLQQYLYGVMTDNNAAAPSTSNFYIRCRLVGLNTEASSVQSDPRAWISYGLVPSLNPIMKTTVAQAAITTAP